MPSMMRFAITFVRPFDYYTYRYYGRQITVDYRT